MIQLLVAAFLAPFGSPCEAAVIELREPIALPLEAPQGIALDESDGSFWICSAISLTVLHLDRELRVLGSIEAPFSQFGRHEVTGIAYRSGADTLLLVQPVLEEIWEVQKDGAPTGLIVPLARLPRPVNPPNKPYVKGTVFDPDGDDGDGSLWLVEGVMTAVHEVSLEGEVLRSFCHPDDPDGCPGEGAAAQSGGIGILRSDGEAAGLELLGGRDRRDSIRQVDLDGVHWGVSFSLEEIGGRPGGFIRTSWMDPRSGVDSDAFLVTVESSAELHVLGIMEPRILPLLGPRCAVAGGSIHLEWDGHDEYERIEVRRDGVVLAQMPGTARSFSDDVPPPGLREYTVVAARGDCEASGRCSVLVGTGQVLRHAPLEARLPVDMARDSDGFIWITDLYGKEIFVHGSDLEFFTLIPSPFQGRDDVTTGIAYHAAADTFFVYNAETNEVVEIDRSGAIAAAAFPSGVASDPEDPALVVAMLFDPVGDGGSGSFWYLDYNTGAVEERSRGGVLLRACVHPDRVAEPTPPGAPEETLLGGMSVVSGRGFPILRMPGGRARDGRITRILSMDAVSCVQVGEEIPVDGLAAFAKPDYFAIHEDPGAGEPVALIGLSGYPVSHLLEIDMRAPQVPRPGPLSCRQVDLARRVRLEFRNPGGLDALEVSRDGIVLGVLPGDAASFDDDDAPEGVRAYGVRGLLGEERGDAAQCTLRVGPGSIASREFAYPSRVLHQLALDPTTGGFVADSLSRDPSESLYRLDAGLRVVATIPSPFRLPLEVAALAVRDAGGAMEVLCLGWIAGATPGNQLEFPLVAVDDAGAVIRSAMVAIPPPPRIFVTFPCGMAWDGGTETLWILERNSATVYNVTLDGVRLSSFPHPAPIHQDFVYNYGLAVDGARNAIWLAGAGRIDHAVTKIVETTRFGTRTGIEIPVGEPGCDEVWGFGIDPASAGIVAFCLDDGVQDIVRFRAFDPVASVRGLTCVREGAAVRLSWENGDLYDAIVVFRDGQETAVLSGTDTGWLDPSPGRGPGLYHVAGRRSGLTGPPVHCGPAVARPFLRGDAEENAVLNISDAVSILSYLFLGGTPPRCLEAADANDSGDVDITDAIALLGYLFLSGRAPAIPFPDAGLDPTPDDLGCGA